MKFITVLGIFVADLAFFGKIPKVGETILGEDLNMSDIAFYHNNQLFIFEYDGDTGMIKYQNKILLKQINY